MASRYAVATGNWSNPAIWDGGTLPQPGDDVRSNGFTVTIDQSIDVTSIQNTALAPAVVGGSFVVTQTGLTITANVTSVASCLTYNAAITLTIIGNMLPLSSGTSVSSNNTSSILYVVGNLFGNTSGFGGNGVATAGTVFVTGDLVGSANNNDALVLTNVAANATITGNVTGGAVGRALGPAAGCTVIVNGNIIGGGANAVSQSPASFTMTVNGNIIGGNAGTGINKSGGLLTVNGDVIGGLSGHALTLSGGQLLGNYTLYGSDTGTGAGINATGAVDMAITNAVFGLIGTSPVIGRVKFANSGAIITVLKQNNTAATYTDINSQDQAAPSDVRLGTTFANGALTGTCAVPNPATVALGVPTDNTVGTYELTVDTNAIASAISTSLETSLPPLLASPLATDFLTEISSSPDPLAERLRNASTVQSTGAQLQSLIIAP